MSSEWRLGLLGEHAETCLGKMLDAIKNKGAPQPYLGNSNVRWGQFDLDNLQTMRFEEDEEERYSVIEGDLIVCEGGEPGRCAVWRGPGQIKIQKALHRVRCGPRLDNDFLFYWFMYAARTGQLEPFFTGTTIKHLTGRALKSLEIPLPPIAEQRAIAGVLRSLDDRIDNLRATNATLESIAQAIFKSWFIDFDPVRAKMEGREPEGMDAETAALFPSEFEESELGLIPRGWGVVPIGEMIESSLGGDWGKEGPDHVHSVRCSIVRGTDLSGLTYCDSSSIPVRFVEPKKLEKRQLIPWDIVFEVSGGSKDQSTGRSLLLRPSHIEALEIGSCCASFCRRFRFVNESTAIWIGTHLEISYRDGLMWHYQNQSTGISNFQTATFLDNHRIVRPSAAVLDRFSALAKPLLEASASPLGRTLAELRDAILPRLISGKLRIGEAQDIVEAVECSN